MKKNILIAALLLSGIMFYSCESNDTPVNNSAEPQNLPTNKVLVELFTNTSCVPCVEANQHLDAVYENSGVTIGDTNVIVLRYAVTLETVRTQVRTVYRKTGTHRQGELVFLVGVLGNG